MKKYALLFCLTILSVEMHGGLKAGTQWQMNGKKIVFLYGTQDFFLEKIRENKDNNVKFTLFHVILREEDKEKFAGIDCFPGYTLDSGVLNLALELKFSENYLQNRNKYLKNYSSLNDNAKKGIDAKVLNFLGTIKLFWKKKGSTPARKRVAELEILFDRRTTIYNTSSKDNPTNIYRSYFIDSCLGAVRIPQEQQKSDEWLVSFMREITYYLNVAFFDDIVSYSKDYEKTYIVGCICEDLPFFTVNTWMAHNQTYHLEKGTLPWHIVTDKHYFQKTDLKKLPNITSSCAQWQYKYLLDKPLTPWENFKFKALSWKKYLIPTAVAGAGLIGAAYWWKQRKALPQQYPVIKER